MLLGGRIGYILFYNFGYYISNPLDILKIWEGGMSFHGALVGIILGTYWFSIKKNIPQEAGLGGGSMNSASLINYLIKKKIISLTMKEKQNLCSKIGSDVNLGIDQKNLVLAYKNKIKKIKKNLKIFTLLVKPNFGCSTKNIYSQVRNFSKPKFLHFFEFVF